ncbi:MAG TPA: hypothetical protein VJG32_15040 [Anaerolineae bacterium]|nr:hypothetical protein [Anaerolineae bacterium]
MNSSEFFGALPDSVRAQLPRPLQNFKVSRRSWLVQLYYTQPLLHYEAWNLGARRGGIELGLHFESRDPAENARLLIGFQSHLFEIKAELGTAIEAEQWDRGWTKVYEVIPRESFTADYLKQVAARLAQIIGVMQPIFEHVYGRSGVTRPKRSAL